jgi:hypothetical protein
MPEPLGNPVNISVFVDANHAGNAVTRRSHSGILIYLQNALIIWQSRRQNTVETSLQVEDVWSSIDWTRARIL